MEDTSWNTKRKLLVLYIIVSNFWTVMVYIIYMQENAGLRKTEDSSPKSISVKIISKRHPNGPYTYINNA